MLLYNATMSNLSCQNKTHEKLLVFTGSSCVRHVLKMIFVAMRWYRKCPYLKYLKRIYYIGHGNVKSQGGMNITWPHQKFITLDAGALARSRYTAGARWYKTSTDMNSITKIGQLDGPHVWLGSASRPVTAQVFTVCVCLHNYSQRRVRVEEYTNFEHFAISLTANIQLFTQFHKVFVVFFRLK